MSSIIIFVNNVQTSEDSMDVLISGKIRGSEMTHANADYVFSAIVPVDALASTINATIKQAALDACNGWEYSAVGALDKKTLIGGAVGL